jgi:2-polyprenyl-3-methyl-5-hydroxy-6-metoxy-1,4-benzoquinol methylase
VSGHGEAVDALRDTWSRYVSDWRENPSLNKGVETLGDEWGGPAFADLVVEELAGPYLGPEVDVLELGCGGGKFSQRLASRSRSLLCTDIAAEMIGQTRANLAARGLGGNVSYRVLDGAEFDGVAPNSVDFIFSYDVLLHLQPQNVFSYLLDARRVLRAGGIFMLHQIDLASPGGMTHFISQYLRGTWRHDLAHPERRGHVFFMSEDQLRALADAAGFGVDRMVVGFPAEGTALWAVTEGRDLIAFLSQRSANRLSDVPLSAISLVQVEGEETVHAVWDGQRAAIQSSYHFDDAGFAWEQVRQITPAELAELIELAPLEAWEWPRADAASA